MNTHTVRVAHDTKPIARRDQLAWMIAEIAGDLVEPESDVKEMVVNRIIDNAAVALAAIGRHPVGTARRQARHHRLEPGSTVFGYPREMRISPEWAAWANGVAVRELDFHDTFLAKEYAHPGDNIAPILAVAQHTGRTGRDLCRAIVTGYEVQIDLAKGICLHEHKIDHIAHLGPSVAAGLGSLLELPIEVTYQAIQQALHTTTTTRQSRKGEISSWKAYAPAFAGKVAIESVDRAMRGEGSPSPIYEGEDGFIAWMLDGRDATYTVALPDIGEQRRAILESYTKEYSAEYQAQAYIDLARRLRDRITDTRAIKDVLLSTSHHTHTVIGSGAHDKEKFDPDASRETLDHSLPYIFAVALEDGTITHESSYTKERAHRPETIALWHKVHTIEDPAWTQRYHAVEPSEMAFGGRATITLNDGSVVEGELGLADAHPGGARPFGRAQYLEKFEELAASTVSREEQERFLSSAQRLTELRADELDELVLHVDGLYELDDNADKGLF